MFLKGEVTAEEEEEKDEEEDDEKSAGEKQRKGYAGCSMKRERERKRE